MKRTAFNLAKIACDLVFEELKTRRFSKSTEKVEDALMESFSDFLGKVKSLTKKQTISNKHLSDLEKLFSAMKLHHSGNVEEAADLWLGKSWRKDKNLVDV